MDMTEVVRSSGTSVGFPVYDAHGNDVATLHRDGSGSYTLADRRSYDAWGQIRQGANANGPRGRYCASLGHVQDDETGLVYMRARYYEPGTGRFLSEDSAHDGMNWFVYAKDDPVGKVDSSGKSAQSGFSYWAFMAVLLAGMAPASMNLPFDIGYQKMVNYVNRMALSDFCGFEVSQSWADRIAEKMGPYAAPTSNASFALNYYGGACTSEVSLCGGVASIAMAYSFEVACALVGCDMAFEEGI